MCSTLEQLRPYRSTLDVDGAKFDAQDEQDIAYDGVTFAEREQHERAQEHAAMRMRRRGEPSM